METGRVWVFRGCHVFDTHEAIFHLDDTGKIVGLECKKIKGTTLWVLTWKSIEWHIWNPVVHTIHTMSEANDSTEAILWELNITYAWRIERILSTKIESPLAA